MPKLVAVKDNTRIGTQLQGMERKSATTVEKEKRLYHYP
jgi:hypothetical protein